MVLKDDKLRLWAEAETWVDMAKRDESLCEEREARCAGREVEGRTASTSYLERASDGESGRPDQITESGSMGGIKRVRTEVGMW